MRIVGLSVVDLDYAPKICYLEITSLLASMVGDGDFVSYNKINCSPITIPSREGIDYLPGILSWDEYFA